MKASLVFIFVLFAFAQISIAQDLTNLKSKTTLRSGATLSMNYNGVASTQDSIVDQADAAVVSLRGHLQWLGFVIPVHFTYRQGQFNAASNNPFVRLGLSPSYKWIKLHVGHRNMLFSRYSLSDITFLGAGVELNPGIFRFAAMYGEIKTPNYNLDTLALHADLISDYKRLAHGIKIGLGKEKNHVDFFYLKGRDKYSLQDTEEIYITKIPPPENLVFGTDVRVLLFKKLNGGFNINLSVMTNNQLNEADSLSDDQSEQIRNIVGSFMTTNITTRANLAGEANLQWQDRYFNLGLQYRRVDPNYQSFGIHYVLDDLENITLNGGLRLYKGRIILNGNIGIQHNNLHEIRRNTSQRTIYNFNSTILVKTNAGLSATYSNFAMDQKAGFVALNDTFRLVQNTSVLNVSPFYRFGKKDISYQVHVNYNQTSIIDLSPFAETKDLAQTQAQVVSFRADYKKTNWNWGISAQRNQSNFREVKSLRTGGSVQVGKRFKSPEIHINLRTGYSALTYNGADDGYVITSTLNTSCQLNKRLSLSILLSYLNKSAVVSRKYDELRFSTNLSYDLIQSRQHEK